MNARQKRILLLIAAAAVLLAVIFAVRSHKKAGAAPAVQTAAAQSDGRAADQIAYTALSYDNGSASLSFSLDEEGKWIWTNDPAFPLDQSYPAKITQLLAALKPQQTITEADAPEAYGLDEPFAALSATAENGSVTTLSFGNATTDGNSYYLLMNHQPTPVYIVSDALYREMTTGIYDMCVLPEIPQIAPERLLSLRLEGGHVFRLTAVVDESGEAPAVSWRAGGKDVTAKVRDLAQEARELKLSACVDYRPSDEAAALCGFDAPDAALTVAYTGDTGMEETLTLYVGKNTLDGAGRYVRLNDDPAIYSMDAAHLDALVPAAVNGIDGVSTPAPEPAAPVESDPTTNA